MSNFLYRRWTLFRLWPIPTMGADDCLSLLNPVSTLKRVYIHAQYLHSSHTMRTVTRIWNEHDSPEEQSSYTESDSPLIKRESSPWYPTSGFKDQKAASKNDTNAATEAHPSSDILDVSDFPPIIEAGTKAIPWEQKSGDRKRKLRGEGKAYFLAHTVIILYYTDGDTSNKENVVELTSSSDAESFPLAVALNSSPPPGLMSPLPILKRKASASISLDGEERKDRNKRLRPIVVSRALHLALMSY
ncbi:hypothetical protein F5887DRAFT_220445 [Amanita rubescens]|nr:hypothetical protein F5887DRAFT_220445 [Amanita rubescens]